MRIFSCACHAQHATVSSVLEMWRKDAIYTFDFWPGAIVEQPRELVFRVAGSRIEVRYAAAGDSDYASARTVAEEFEERLLSGFEPSAVVSSGVSPVSGWIGEAWRCRIVLSKEKAAIEVVGCSVDEGLVATIVGPGPCSFLAQAELGGLDVVARSLGLVGRDEVTVAPGHMLYLLGPIQFSVPQQWEPSPRVSSALTGAPLMRRAGLAFGFASGATPPAEWLEKPGCAQYADSFVYDEVPLVKSELATQTFASGEATAVYWAAVPRAPQPGSRPPADDVVCEATAVLHWQDGGFTGVSLDQTVPYSEFDESRDNTGLRDLVLRIATSGRRRPRISGEG